MRPQITYMRLLVFTGIISSFSSVAQVGIGTTSPQGALDINSSNGGLVMPRTNLTSVNDISTITTPTGEIPVEGTIIYDTGDNITEGFYVHDGSRWQSLMGADTNTYLGMEDQTLDADRDIFLSGYDLNLDIANDGTNALNLDTGLLSFSRDPGDVSEAIISARNGITFNIDNNDDNNNDAEFFAWGENGELSEGTGDSNYREYMRLDDTGLGIGTDNPEYLVHAQGASGNNIAKFESADFPMFGGFIIEDNDGSNTAKFVISPGNIANNSSSAMSGVPSTNSNARNSVTFDMEGSQYDIYTFMEGEIRPGFDNLTTLGAANHRFTDIYLVNNPTVTSDIRLKDNIIETKYGLETVMQVTPVSYQLISDDTNEVHLGFKAQEIQELIPEIVNTAPDSGMLSMAYAEMIPVLTKAIQELNEKLDVVIDENTKLKEQNTAILNHVAQRN